MGRWPSGLGAGLQNRSTGVRILHGLLILQRTLYMAWYWWLLIVVTILGLIGAINSHNEQIRYEEEAEDSVNRLRAIILLDGLKYTHPDVWAKCVSDIVDRPVDPPTLEQIEKWKMRKWEQEAKRDSERSHGNLVQ